MKLKKYILLSFSVMALPALFLVMGGCKSNQANTSVQAPKPDTGAKPTETYCSGPEYQSDEHFFRAANLGESADQATARSKALNNAKEEVAGLIRNTLKTTFDYYVKAFEINNTPEIRVKYDSLSLEVIDRKLSSVKVVCEKQTVTQNFTYKTYTTVEISGDDVLTQMNESLSGTNAIFTGYDAEKYKKFFAKAIK